jgi:hypothetical protein
MAIFKSTARPNISGSSGSPTKIIAAADIPAGRYAVLIGLSAVNRAVSPSEATIQLVKGGGGATSHLSYKLPLPVNSGFELQLGKKVILESGDELVAYANAANAVDVTCSYMTNAQGT